jgi:hypothetical protein
MILALRLLVLACLQIGCAELMIAQTLAPRAYIVTPLGANALTLSWSFYDGGVNFNGAVPITQAKNTYHVPVLSYYHSFGLFGRSANVTGVLPYGIGTFQGSVQGVQKQIYRSGVLDAGVRFAINLKGGPAIRASEFTKWKQRSLLGISVTMIVPTGQYNGSHLINWGINRWAFKPELGYSQRRGNWLFDAYGGAWFYTTNDASFALPTPQPQTEHPIGSFETHLSYDFNRFRGWASLDGNVWFGGLAVLNNVPNSSTRQLGSRIGGTTSFPITKHQSIKSSYSAGTYSRFGGNYQMVSVGWQYSWLGWPPFKPH